MKSQTFAFRVDGPLNSYKCFRDESWKGLALRITQAARASGVPEFLGLKLNASLAIQFHWEKNARFDISNVVKLFEDAIWACDRRIQSICAQHRGYSDGEYALVWVTVQKRKRGVNSVEAARGFNLYQREVSAADVADAGDLDVPLGQYGRQGAVSRRPQNH